MQTHALLRKENWTLGTQLDRQGDDGKGHHRQDKTDESKNNIPEVFKYKLPPYY